LEGIKTNEMNNLGYRFSVAPMMDWTGTSQKAKRDQHLSHVSIGHVVPNEVPPLVRSFDEQAISRSCVC
jgi:hypothetical protein